MASPDPLSRLVGCLEGTLAMYISDSGIGSYPGAEEIKRALADLVADHRKLIERAGGILQEREVAVPRTAYPMSFTAWHDLDLRYLIPRVVEGLRRQVDECAAIASAGAADAAVTELAGETRTATRRHIDVLEQLAVRLRAGLAGGNASPAGAAL